MLDTALPRLSPIGSPTLLSRRRVTFIAMTILATGMGLWLLCIATTRQGRTILGPGLGGDFACFYSAATILNDQQPDRLYDFSLQAFHYHRLLPDESPDAALPYAYPPIVAVLFRPLAILPYASSCVAWGLISIGAYCAGLILLTRTCRGILPEDRWLAILLSLAFEPFLIETLHGGQLSAIAFALVCLAIWLDRNGHSLKAGVVLSLCVYKPTLLPMIVPMLLFTGRWRAMAGFMIGAGFVIGASIFMVGPTTCLAYLHVLTAYGQHATGGETFFRTWKFVDLNSFLKLLLGRPISMPLIAGLITTLLAAGLVSKRLGANAATGDQTGARSISADAWAAALAGSLVLNLYTGIYDTVLIVPSFWLLVETYGLTPGMKRLLAAIFIAPWISQTIAFHWGFQPFTILIAVTAVASQWKLLASAITIPMTPANCS